MAIYPQAILSAAIAGIGIAHLAHDIVEPYIAKGQLVTVLDESATTPLVGVSAQNLPRTLAIEHLTNELLNKIHTFRNKASGLESINNNKKSYL